MLSILRRINLVLLVVVVWQGYLFIRSEPANAQAAPFLYRPYYGPFITDSITASFDHTRPTYAETDVTFTRWQGDSKYGPPLGTDDISVTNDGVCTNVSGAHCYNGHPGYDLLLGSAGDRYQPVVASAAGQIDWAGWSSTQHDILLGLKIGINHWNNYRTVYGHLSMVRYQTGTNVGQWQIGTSGTTGNATGPHLHFEVQRYQNSKWRVTDPYGWRDRYNNNDNGDDPWPNDPSGDGVISTYVWVDNPLQPPPPNNGSSYKDDGDSGFSTQCLSGNYWWTVNNAGYNNDLRYTYVNGQTVNCWANWNVPALPSTGQYEVEVYVSVWNGANRTNAARYRVKHANGEQTVVVDQHRVGYSGGGYSGGDQWISLGRYNFSQGSPTTEFVQVADAAYIGSDVDPADSYRTILVDAVRWVKTH